MAALNTTDGTTFIRRLCRLTNTSFPGAIDAEILDLINFWYMWWYKIIENRRQLVTMVTATVSGTRTYSTDAGFVYPEILSVLRQVGGVPTIGLEKADWNELLELQNRNSTTGAPLRYAAAKLHGSSEKWTVALHPIPDAVYVISANVRVYPTALTAGATPELGEAEAYWMYRLAASDVAFVAGRDDRCARIEKPIPASIMKKAEIELKRADPKRRPTAVVA